MESYHRKSYADVLEYFSRWNMTEQDIITIARETIWIIVQVALPVLLVSMIVGLTVSLIQTITSIQEQTLTFVPKMLAIFVTLLLLGSWMINTISGFMIQLWGSFNQYIH